MNYLNFTPSLWDIFCAILVFWVVKSHTKWSILSSIIITAITSFLMLPFFGCFVKYFWDIIVLDPNGLSLNTFYHTASWNIKCLIDGFIFTFSFVTKAIAQMLSLKIICVFCENKEIDLNEKLLIKLILVYFSPIVVLLYDKLHVELKSFFTNFNLL